MLLLDFMFLQVMFPPMLNWYLGECMDPMIGINTQYRYYYQRTYPTGIQIVTFTSHTLSGITR